MTTITTATATAAARRRDDRDGDVAARLQELGWASLPAAFGAAGSATTLLRDAGYHTPTPEEKAEAAARKVEAAAKRARFETGNGISKLFGRAAQQWARPKTRSGGSTKGGNPLPWNFEIHLPHGGDWDSAPKGSGRSPAIGEVARFCGWIEAAAGGYYLRRLFRRVLSPKGWFSPSTKVGPADVVELTRAHSPGRANRLAAAVRSRANEILSPYGLRVSNVALFRALLMGGTRVGKLAHWAAEETGRLVLQGNGVRYQADGRRGLRLVTGETRYRPARGDKPASGGAPIYGGPTTALALLRGYAAFKTADEAVRAWAFTRLAAGEFTTIRDAIAASGRLVSASSVNAVADGVDGLADPALAREYRGVSVTPVASMVHPHRGRSYGTVTAVVRAGNRTYHASALGWRDAVEEARRAWALQDEAERHQREAKARGSREGEAIVAILNGNDPRATNAVVTREDSRRAGNCVAGTEQWISRMGIDARLEALPLATAWQLALTSGEKLAQAACRQAARRVLQLVG